MAKTDLIVTSQFIMRLFGLSQPGLSRLCAAGAPRAGRNAYDVRLFLGWWLDNIYSDNGNACNDDELKAARALYWKAKAEEQALKTATLQGEYLPAAEARKAWAQRAIVLFANLDNLQNRLPAALEGKDRAGMYEVIRSELTALRIGLWKPDEPYIPALKINRKR